MTIGTFEFTEHGAKPFVSVKNAQGSYNTSSVTVDIADTNQEGITLCEGMLYPGTSGEGSQIDVELQGSTGTVRNSNSRVWANALSGNGYRLYNSNKFRLVTYGVDSSPYEGAFFQIWFTFNTNNSFPYSDVTYYYRSMNYVTSGSGTTGVRAYRGMGRAMSSGDYSKARFFLTSGTFYYYRIRCYNFFGNN